MAIYNHIAQLVHALIGVGGSEDAHRVLKRMKFQERQGFETWGRVTRPVRLFLDGGEKGLREVARLGRNLWRGCGRVGRAEKGVECAAGFAVRRERCACAAEARASEPYGVLSGYGNFELFVVVSGCADGSLCY